MDDQMSLSGTKILAIAPHADDESQGCGGLIARAVNEGADVAVLVVSVADLAQYGHHHSIVEGNTRLRELETALGILGVARWAVLFNDMAHNMRLDTIPMVELVSALERGSDLALDSFRPDVLLIPAPSYNHDHQVVYNAALAACRPHLRQQKHFVPQVLCYEQPQLRWGSSAGNPNYYVDISAVIDTKLRACEAHQSQAKSFPHNSSLDNIRNLAYIRGSDIAVTAAEAYYCIRQVI